MTPAMPIPSSSTVSTSGTSNATHPAPAALPATPQVTPQTRVSSAKVPMKPKSKQKEDVKPDTVHSKPPLDVNNSQFNTSDKKALVITGFDKVVWEDQGVSVYSLEAGDHVLCRRADNNMMNGTKLLNMANLSRGVRDGLLKKEKVRQVVKIGPLPLKGVWYGDFLFI